jgi:UDP-N-acetylmuramoyl-tripeptide--D-alanyl-D-alanine ligase
MIDLTIGEIADAVSGTIFRGEPSGVISGAVETDSREITPGGVFVAKLGEREDGHRYVVDAMLSGATLAIVSTPVAGAEIDQIVVDDTVEALGLLAEYVLNQVRFGGQLKVVGITGSNGKTATKNLLAKMLEPIGETIAPIASLNNEVGLPITVLRITHQTKFLVLELGAAGVGSIERLARWTKPEIGIQLKVGMAHAGEFGGIDVTEKIKAELMPYIKETAVLNFDDPRVRHFRFSGRRVGFGFATDADYQLVATEFSLSGTLVKLSVRGKRYQVKLQILGEHQVMNLMAALAAADLLGASIEQCLKIAEQINMVERWRMQLTRAPGGYWVINDAYNASPDSMRAALQTLAVLGRQGHRTVAVLGQMAELGEFSAQEHDAIGRLVVRLNIDKLYVVGAAAKLIHMAASQEGSWSGESEFIDTSGNAFDMIHESLAIGDVVLVKASNIAGLRFLGDELAGVR